MLDHPILGALTVDQWMKFHEIHTATTRSRRRAPARSRVDCLTGACPMLAVWHTIRRSRDNDFAVVRETSPVVLVVEDDSAVRQPLVKFLQMRQYTVVTAETADEGLDAIKTHRPAAAIVDLRLRRGSGREVVVSAPPEFP